MEIGLDVRGGVEVVVSFNFIVVAVLHNSYVYHSTVDVVGDFIHSEVITVITLVIVVNSTKIICDVFVNVDEFVVVGLMVDSIDYAVVVSGVGEYSADMAEI